MADKDEDSTAAEAIYSATMARLHEHGWQAPQFVHEWAVTRSLRDALGLPILDQHKPKRSVLEWVEKCMEYWVSPAAKDLPRAHWIREAEGLKRDLAAWEPAFERLDATKVANSLKGLQRKDAATRLVSDLADMICLEGWNVEALKKAGQR